MQLPQWSGSVAGWTLQPLAGLPSQLMLPVGHEQSPPMQVRPTSH
jgi:hypothetical protein